MRLAFNDELDMYLLFVKVKHDDELFVHLAGTISYHQHSLFLRETKIQQLTGVMKELDGCYWYSSFGSLNRGLVGSSWLLSPSDPELGLMRELADLAVQTQGGLVGCWRFFHNLHTDMLSTWPCSTFLAMTKLYQR